MKDKELSLAIQESLKQEKERKERDQEISSLNKLLKQKEDEINQIKQEKEEYVSANYRQRSRIISLEKDIKALQNERDLIQIRNREFIQQNNKLKVKQPFHHHPFICFFFILILRMMYVSENKWSINGRTKRVRIRN